jgi:hypothetical protein
MYGNSGLRSFLFCGLFNDTLSIETILCRMAARAIELKNAPKDVVRCKRGIMPEFSWRDRRHPRKNSEWPVTVKICTWHFHNTNISFSILM